MRRVLGQLERDSLVSSVERKETHGHREVMQQYFRVDHKQALDAVKLRLKRMKKALEAAPVERVTQYVCSICEDDDGRHPTWDEHDVQELETPFVCPHCGGDLEEEVVSQDDSGVSVNIGQRVHSQLMPLNESIRKTENFTLPAPRAQVPQKRGQLNAGEQQQAGVHGGLDMQGAPLVQAKKIVLSLDGAQGQGAPAWQQLQGGVAPGAASSLPTAALGSFQALHSNKKQKTEHDDEAAAAQPGGERAGGGTPKASDGVDAAGSDFIRQYQEQCRLAQEAQAAAGSREGAAAAGDRQEGAEGEGEFGMEEEDEFEEEEEDILVMVNGKEMSLYDVEEVHEEQVPPSVAASIYRFVCLSACLPACLSASLSAFLPACLSACLPACLPACRSILPHSLGQWLCVFLLVCLGISRARALPPSLPLPPKPLPSSLISLSRSHLSALSTKPWTSMRVDTPILTASAMRCARCGGSNRCPRQSTKPTSKPASSCKSDAIIVINLLAVTQCPSSRAAPPRALVTSFQL